MNEADEWIDRQNKIKSTLDNETIDINKFFKTAFKIIKENWLVLILLLLILLMTIIHINALSGCNSYYQEILKNCVILKP